MFTFTYDAIFIFGNNPESEFSSFNGCQCGSGLHSLSFGSRFDMRDIKVPAYSCLPFFQFVFDSHHGCVFHECGHGGSGKYFKIAAAYMGGKLGFRNKQCAGVR